MGRPQEIEQRAQPRNQRPIVFFDRRGHLPASKTDHRENRLPRKARAMLEPEETSMPARPNRRALSAANPPGQTHSESSGRKHVEVVALMVADSAIYGTTEPPRTGRRFSALRPAIEIAVQQLERRRRECRNPCRLLQPEAHRNGKRHRPAARRCRKRRGAMHHGLDFLVEACNAAAAHERDRAHAAARIEAEGNAGHALIAAAAGIGRETLVACKMRGDEPAIVAVGVGPAASDAVGRRCPSAGSCRQHGLALPHRMLLLGLTRRGCLYALGRGHQQRRNRVPCQGDGQHRWSRRRRRRRLLGSGYWRSFRGGRRLRFDLLKRFLAGLGLRHFLRGLRGELRRFLLGFCRLLRAPCRHIGAEHDLDRHGFDADARQRRRLAVEHPIDARMRGERAQQQSEHPHAPILFQGRRRGTLTGHEPDLCAGLARLALAFDEWDDIGEIRGGPGWYRGLRAGLDTTGQHGIAATVTLGGRDARQAHARLSCGLRRRAKPRTVGIETRLQHAPSRKIARGCPWSMSQPNSSGDTMPPRLKPVVTNPNTLPNDPGGANERTIISRDGMISTANNPPMAIEAINNITKNARLRRSGSENRSFQPSPFAASSGGRFAARGIGPPKASRWRIITAAAKTPSSAAATNAPRQPTRSCSSSKAGGATADPSMPAKVWIENACPIRWAET